MHCAKRRVSIQFYTLPVNVLKKYEYPREFCFTFENDGREKMVEITTDRPKRWMIWGKFEKTGLVTVYNLPYEKEYIDICLRLIRMGVKKRFDHLQQGIYDFKYIGGHFFYVFPVELKAGFQKITRDIRSKEMFSLYTKKLKHDARLTLDKITKFSQFDLKFKGDLKTVNKLWNIIRRLVLSEYTKTRKDDDNLIIMCISREAFPRLRLQCVKQ